MNSSRELVGNYWTPTNTTASNPLPILNNPLSSARLASTRFLQSSDFVRLKEVALSYRLPSSLTKTLHVNSASVSLTANNLFYLYAATKIRSSRRLSMVSYGRYPCSAHGELRCECWFLTLIPVSR